MSNRPERSFMASQRSVPRPRPLPRCPPLRFRDTALGPCNATDPAALISLQESSFPSARAVAWSLVGRQHLFEDYRDGTYAIITSWSSFWTPASLSLLSWAPRVPAARFCAPVSTVAFALSWEPPSSQSTSRSCREPSCSREAFSPWQSERPF